MQKSLLNKLNIAKIFFGLFVASLFFSIHYVFPTKEAFQTGAYSDFTSISLYLSDIFLFITWCWCFLPRGGKDFWSEIKDKGLIIFIIWLILNQIWHYQSLLSLNWWFFAKYLELIVAYGTTSYLFSKIGVKALFLKVFISFSTFESILAAWQFVFQKSAGSIFHKLGEQVLAANMQGVAKIVSSGTTYIRGYGTFPHPNLLSAFLVTGVLFSLYLAIKSVNFKFSLVYYFVLLANLVGLSLTFSRASFLAVAVGLVIFFGHLFFFPVMATRKKILTGAAIVLVCVLANFILFKPYLLTRATITDDAALERIFYAKVGIQMIKANPVFGTGIEDSVIHMQQYSPIKLWPWQIQPIHNYFLLAAAELGIPGALVLIWIFLSHLWRLTSSKTKKLTADYVLLTAIFSSFLVLMQFDHYFYTLQQTQMLLWVVLGMISAQIKNPQI